MQGPPFGQAPRPGFPPGPRLPVRRPPPQQHDDFDESYDGQQWPQVSCRTFFVHHISLDFLGLST